MKHDNKDHPDCKPMVDDKRNKQFEDRMWVSDMLKEYGFEYHIKSYGFKDFSIDHIEQNQVDTVIELINGLTDFQRDCILYRYRDRMTYEQMRAKLFKGEETTKRAIKKGIMRLKCPTRTECIAKGTIGDVDMIEAYKCDRLLANEIPIWAIEAEGYLNTRTIRALEHHGLHALDDIIKLTTGGGHWVQYVDDMGPVGEREIYKMLTDFGEDPDSIVLRLKMDFESRPSKYESDAAHVGVYCLYKAGYISEDTCSILEREAIKTYYNLLRMEGNVYAYNLEMKRIRREYGESNEAMVKEDINDCFIKITGKSFHCKEPKFI